MNSAKSSAAVAACLATLLQLLLSAAECPHARAFGGLWSTERGAVQQHAESVVLIDNPDSTVTAIVQVVYSAPRRDAVWLTPVAGQPKVGLSSNTALQRLETATAPQYWVEVAREEMCSSQHDPDVPVNLGDMTVSTPSPDDALAMVEAIERGLVGPYEYTTIRVDEGAREPVKAATEWLSANGFALTGHEPEVLEPYLRAGQNLLAFKLAAGAEVSRLKPVMLTYESKQPTLPIRPMALTAQNDTQLHVWVVGPSQAVPVNYRSLVLNDARIDWLTAGQFPSGTLPSGGAGPFGEQVPRPSNYDAVVSAAADEAGGQAFVTERAGPASQYRDKVWSAAEDDQFEVLANQAYADGFEALAAASTYRGWDGWTDAVSGAAKMPPGLTVEEFLDDPEQYRGQVDIDIAHFFELLDTKVRAPMVEFAELLHRAPYLTRLYTTLSPSEMTLDPVFDYNFELAQVSGVNIAEQFLSCDPDAGSWRLELPQGSVVTSDGGDGWPMADALPANFKTVMLSTAGSGRVLTDHSEDIRAALTPGDAPLQTPQTGVAIGGSQSLHGPQAEDTAAPADGGCSAVPGAAPHHGVGLWILALAAFFRRRRLLPLCACLVLVACDSSDALPTSAPRSDAANMTTSEAALVDTTLPEFDAGPLPPGALTREQLRDPQSCSGCHPAHYREWSSSMHAYSAQDPVFIAMNKRGQRETGGKLGDFCIKCHAPMAVVDKLSTDGLNLDQLADRERGVSCYFCHNVDRVAGDHNALLQLANDNTMRGSIRDPQAPTEHRARYSELFEHVDPQSSALCGGCHDIVTQNGVHLERTLAEYRHGIFSKSASTSTDSTAFDSCLGCHMPGRQEPAAVVAGAPIRTVHEHLWPGVDVPLTDFPNRAAMRSAVEDCQLGTASVSFFTLEVTPPDLFTFQFETNAGHNQPSGSAQDRRLWLEFSAYDENDKLLTSVSSGRIADEALEEHAAGHPEHDPQLAMFRDRIFDTDGKPAHMFWDAAKSAAHPDGYESEVLPSATTTYIDGKHAVIKQYRASGPNGLPARVTARLKMRPIGQDVLQDLVASGDLDPAIAAQMPTFTFGTQIEWRPSDGMMKSIAGTPRSDCQTYSCMLDPTRQGCR